MRQAAAIDTLTACGGISEFQFVARSRLERLRSKPAGGGSASSPVTRATLHSIAEM
jgi:hypothetical protein